MSAIYIVGPKSLPQEYFGAEVYELSGHAPAHLIADLSITTVAGLVPADFEITLCDEHIQSVDLDTPCTFVALTGKETQALRLIELAKAFRARGRIIIAGGPFVSMSPEAVRPHCDIVVIGEIEEIAQRLFADLRTGTWQAEYQGTRPDLSLAPIPRWDLYANDRALIGSVQTSRGCPFACEFCDVPVFVGRRQRHKAPEQVLAELDVLYAHGYRSVFLADDNFTVYRRAAKELLAALAWWNARQTDGAVSFSTQVSVDAADDPELLRMCNEAGISFAFIGLESPNEDSLRETKKRQNLRGNIADQVDRFLENNIMLTSGLIIGFDADGPDIFDRVEAFVDSLPIPVFSLGALTAPPGTPLRARLAAEGRLASDFGKSTGQTGGTNVLPKQMTRDALITGIREVKRRIYTPEAYGRRVTAMIDRLGPNLCKSNATVSRIPKGRMSLARDTDDLFIRMARGTPGERKMVAQTTRHTLRYHPRKMDALKTSIRFYAQVRAVERSLSRE